MGSGGRKQVLNGNGLGVRKLEVLGSVPHLKSKDIHIAVPALVPPEGFHAVLSVVTAPARGCVFLPGPKTG